MKDVNYGVENINPGPNPVNPARRLWPGLLLLLYSLLKLWLVAGVELGKDEAAYWYWGQHLDATYALLPFGLLRLAHLLLPHQVWFLRLFPILSGALAILLAYRLCRLHGLEASLSLWAAAALATSHWIWHTSSYLHPDGFLVTCWLLSLCLARQTIGRKNPGVYVRLGIAIGLTLLCKYSGAFLAVALFSWILLTRPAAVRWRLFLYALLPALLITSPLIHAQLSTCFYLPTTLSSLSQIAADSNLFLRLLNFLLNPLFFVSPLLLYLFYRVWGHALIDLRRRVDPERALTFLPALVPVLAFAFFALYRGQIKGNWILPAFLSLLPLAFSRRILPARPRWFLILTLLIGLFQAMFIGVALKYPGAARALGEIVDSSRANATYVQLVSTADRQREPSYSWTERLCEYHGWRQLSADLEKLLRQKQVHPATPLTSTQYSIPFSLAYYGFSDRSCYTLDDPRFRDLTDFHHQAGPAYPQQVLFAVRSGSPLPASIESIYPKKWLLGEIPRTAQGCEPVHYQVFLFIRGDHPAAGVPAAPAPLNQEAW